MYCINKKRGLNYFNKQNLVNQHASIHFDKGSVPLTLIFASFQRTVSFE